MICSFWLIRPLYCFGYESMVFFYSHPYNLLNNLHK